jgi:hypothetical protein
MSFFRFTKFFDAGEKLHRARMHIGSAEKFVRHYNQTSVHLDLRHDPETGENTLSFAPAKFNAELLTTVGDAIHNLSSALDCATSLIVAERSGHANRRIYFPTHENMEQLKASFETRREVPCKCGTGTVERQGSNSAIRKFVPELERLVVDVFKPCSPDNFLWQIRKADNIDKHNTLVLAIANVTSTDLNFTTKEGFAHIQNLYTLRPGQSIPLGISKHPFELFNNPTFNVEFVFGGGNPMTGQKMFQWLNGAYQATLTTIIEFERTFGRLEDVAADGTVIAPAEATPAP